MKYPKLRQTELIVNLNNIQKNIDVIKEKIGENIKIMPIIKADAYGTGVEGILKVISNNNINIVGVAIVDEGIYLRELGFDGEIFVLNQPLEEELDAIYEYNLVPGISSKNFVELIGARNKPIKIHIEIGTGMGRTGVNPYKLNNIIDVIKKYKNIDVEGIYTHFSSSDCDYDYTKKQIESFEIAIKVIKEEFNNIKYIHTCNSCRNFKFSRSAL